MPKILMISTFGPNVRGVSPYSDSLYSKLSCIRDIDIERLDYRKPFPNFILPAGTSYNADNEFATLDYLSPKSWAVNKNSEYDILHIQYWSPAFLPLLLGILFRTRKHSCKTIITWHNPSLHESLPIIGLLEKYLLRLSDHVICHTLQGKQILLSGLPSAKISIIHHGCNSIGYDQADESDYKQLGLSPSKEYLLYFGNIRPYKGVDLLLDAWEMIAPKFPNVILIITGRPWKAGNSLIAKTLNFFLGTDRYSRLIKEKIENSRAPVLSELHFISEKKLHAYIKVSKLGVFPYRSFDSQSGAASLAAGLGLPFITTGVGGLSDLALDQSFISKDISAKSIATILQDKLSNYHPSLRAEQYRKSLEMSWEKSAERHAEVYRQVIL